MKKVLSIFSLAFVLGFTFVSCEKETERIAADTMVGSDKALLKINVVSQYIANPSFQLKLNDVRVSNLIQARSPFPGSGFNTIGAGSQSDYLAVNPGQTSLKVSIPNKGAETDSIVLFNTNIATAAGKYYTAHISDTGTNTQMLLLEDNIQQPANGMSKYRFVNLMPNAPALDLYYGTTVVASNVAFMTSSPYFELPMPSTSLAWTIRETGTSPTSTALATYTSSNTSLNRRVYTAFASGYKGQTSTSSRRPFISFLLNY